MAKCLEELKNSKRVVSFLGHGFSLDFIPLGQSIPLLQAYQEMINLEKSPQTSIQELLTAKIKMTARFCSFVYPNLDEDYILKHAQLAELDDFFVQLIRCVLQEISVLNRTETASQDAKKKKMTWEQSLDLFCIVFGCTEEYILHNYNLTAFSRKLKNGLHYRLQIAGVYIPREEDVESSSTVSKEDFYYLSQLYFDKRRLRNGH